MPKELDFGNLRKCIDNFEADRLFIRLIGAKTIGKTKEEVEAVKVVENLEGRKLDFKKNENNLYMLVDGEKKFHFSLKNYQKGFSLAYERIIPTEDRIGRMVILQTGINPDDPDLPEPRRSFLRNVLDDHLIEIFFKGRIPLKFHSWWSKDKTWKYWTVDV